MFKNKKNKYLEKSVADQKLHQSNIIEAIEQIRKAKKEGVLTTELHDKIKSSFNLKAIEKKPIPDNCYIGKPSEYQKFREKGECLITLKKNGEFSVVDNTNYVPYNVYPKMHIKPEISVGEENIDFIDLAEDSWE